MQLVDVFPSKEGEKASKQPEEARSKKRKREDDIVDEKPVPDSSSNQKGIVISISQHMSPSSIDFVDLEDEVEQPVTKKARTEGTMMPPPSVPKLNLPVQTNVEEEKPANDGMEVEDQVAEENNEGDQEEDNNVGGEAVNEDFEQENAVENNEVLLSSLIVFRTILISYVGCQR
jgi:hypothetical protein